MASKRQYLGDFAEESYSSDEDDIEMPSIEQRPRGRPPKMSANHLSSMDVTTSHTGAETAASAPRRRGRGPSKRPCLNRNALMARENRQRKKEYIERIESKLQYYQKENQELNATIQKQNVEIKRLGNEVKYLKNVLENNTHITSLMRAVNESLRKMHGQTEEASESANGLSRPGTDVLNWVVRGQTKTPNNMSIPVSGTTNKIKMEVSKEDVSSNRISFGTSPSKIARKTMPLKMPQCDNPPSNESYYDDHMPMKSSPQSGSCCEYNTDKSSSRVATTPMSTMSNSVDKCEASLSDTDFSQLSALDVGYLDNIDPIEDVPLQFDQDTLALFNEDTLFYPLDKDDSIIKNSLVDPLETTKTSNDQTFFTSPENPGVCLHINSSRVSLEYCSYCHMNSLNNLNSQIAV